MMKRVICIMLGLFLMSGTTAAQEKQEKKKTGELTDPVEILKKVDAAAKAVKAVKYDVTYEQTGGPGEGMKLKASITHVGYVDGGPEKGFVEVEYTQPDSKEVRKLTSGTDGEMFYVIDHKAKKAYEDIDPAVVGSFRRTLLTGVMFEFIHPTPFSDEIKGKEQKLKGSKKINGEDCYEISVVYAVEQAPKAVWCFSKKDFLPRQRIDSYSSPGRGTMTMTKTISKLTVDPKLGKDAFKLKLPKGYTKTDDFAP